MDLKKTTTLAYLAFKAVNNLNIDGPQELDKILAFEDADNRIQMFETLPAEYEDVQILVPTVFFHYGVHEKLGQSTFATASIPFLQDGHELRLLFSVVENDVEEDFPRARIMEIALISVAPTELDKMVLFNIKRRDTDGRCFGNIKLQVNDCLPGQDLRDNIGIALNHMKRKELVDIETRNLIDTLRAALHTAENYGD